MAPLPPDLSPTGAGGGRPPSPAPELDLLRELRARRAAEGPLFWHREDELAVLCPATAQRANALNSADLVLPERLADLLRGRTGEPVPWRQVRGVWLAQLQRLGDAPGLARLSARMDALLTERSGRPVDLVWAIQEVFSRALLPVVMDGLPLADRARVVRDQGLRLRGILDVSVVPRRPLLGRLAALRIRAAAALAVRRELRGRGLKRRPRRLDLADAVVDLLPELGMDRAMSAVLGLLAAIGGPPGAAAVCLAYELGRQRGWAERITAELAAVAPEELHAAPTRAAPLTQRFVKETLRLWSPPLLLARTARRDIDLGAARLAVGQRYLLSPHLMQRDPRHWDDPDRFDPDRWTERSGGDGAENRCYFPFGFAPRACVGAGLGMAQLVLLCHLLSTRYRVEVTAPDAVRMALAAVAVPQGFHGTIHRR